VADGLPQGPGGSDTHGGRPYQQAVLRQDRNMGTRDRSSQVCRKTTHVETLEQDYLELEGERLEIISEVMDDMRYNTMVWIPSIKTLYASDVLFNQAHPFTCELTAEERKRGSKNSTR